MKREVRVISGANLRARKGEGKPQGCEGYAAVFNQEAVIYEFGNYRMREKIAPGAFARAIKEKQDVRCLQNHDANMVMGRTKNGSLRLAEDGTGLAFDCDFPATQMARDLHALLDRGDVDQCSFSFTVNKETWTTEKKDDGSVDELRVVEDVDLYDVGPVTFPAYEGTSVQARCAFPDGVPEAIEKRQKQAADAQASTVEAGKELLADIRKIAAEKKDGDGAGESDPTGGDVEQICACDCPQCKEGNCAACSDPDCTDKNCKDAEPEEMNSKLSDFEVAELQFRAKANLNRQER